MTENDVLNVLSAMGWSVSTDDCDVNYGTITLQDRVVQVIPTIGLRADHFRVSFMPSVSTKLFSLVVGSIAEIPVSNTPITRMQEHVSKIRTLDAVQVSGFHQRILSWAKSVDIDAGLQVYRHLSLESEGAMPLRHIAALALFGDCERLKGYRERITAGDRIGVANYITSELLDRAIAISVKRITKD